MYNLIKVNFAAIPSITVFCCLSLPARDKIVFLPILWKITQLHSE